MMKELLNKEQLLLDMYNGYNTKLALLQKQGAFEILGLTTSLNDVRIKIYEQSIKDLNAEATSSIKEEQKRLERMIEITNHRKEEIKAIFKTNNKKNKSEGTTLEKEALFYNEKLNTIKNYLKEYEKVEILNNGIDITNNNLDKLNTVIDGYDQSNLILEDTLIDAIKEVIAKLPAIDSVVDKVIETNRIISLPTDLENIVKDVDPSKLSKAELNYVANAKSDNFEVKKTYFSAREYQLINEVEKIVNKKLKEFVDLYDKRLEIKDYLDELKALASEINMTDKIVWNSFYDLILNQINALKDQVDDRKLQKIYKNRIVNDKQEITKLNKKISESKDLEKIINEIKDDIAEIIPDSVTEKLLEDIPVVDSPISK